MHQHATLTDRKNTFSDFIALVYPGRKVHTSIDKKSYRMYGGGGEEGCCWIAGENFEL